MVQPGMASGLFGPCHAVSACQAVALQPTHALLQHATPRYAMPCHAMPCHATPCQGIHARSHAPHLRYVLSRAAYASSLISYLSTLLTSSSQPLAAGGCQV